MRFILLFSLLFLFASADERRCYFVPPSGWEIAHLKKPSPHLKVGFLGKGSTEFRPSINLATEEIDGSLKDYVKAVKELQAADPKIKWRDLGDFSMQGGMGRLVQMSTRSAAGEIEILQAFLLADRTIYMLTTAVLKKDFPHLQPEVLKSLRSLDLIDDLCSPIADVETKSHFQTLFASLQTPEKPKWDDFQAEIESFSQLGPYWQFLALQEGRMKMENHP